MEEGTKNKVSTETDVDPIKLTEFKEEIINHQQQSNNVVAMNPIHMPKYEEKVEAELEQKVADMTLCKIDKESGYFDRPEKALMRDTTTDEESTAAIRTVAAPSTVEHHQSLKWEDDALLDQSGDLTVEKEPETKTPKAPRTDSCKDDNGFTYFKCRFCGLTFNYMTTLKAHERVHDIAQPYLCNKCGESFHFMCELEYHAKTHLQQKGYKCECGRTFFQYTDLLYHKHPGEDEPFPTVPLPSASVGDFGTLMATPPSRPSIHPAEFPTPEFAEQGFEPKYQLKRGLSDVRSKPYICQYCSKSYSDSRGLAYHMYSHRGERVFNPRASRYLMCRNDNSYISPGLDLRDA